MKKEIETNLTLEELEEIELEKEIIRTTIEIRKKKKNGFNANGIK